MIKNVFVGLLLLASTNALSESTFQKLFGLIQIQNLNITRMFNEKSKSNIKYDCQMNDFKRRLLRESEVSFDAGYDGCGWEISSINFLCKGKSIQNLWAELRRVASPLITKQTSLITTEQTNKSFTVPLGKYIASLSTGYIFDGDTQFASQLSIKLNDGTSKDLICGQAEVFVKTEVSSRQRIDGMQMVIDKQDRFSFIDFHLHEIVTKSQGRNLKKILLKSSKGQSKSQSKGKGLKKKSEYIDYLRSKFLQLGRLEDDFYLRGPVGLNDGKYFTDQKYYSDWQLASVRIEADNKRIYSIQLILNHTIFEKTVRTKVQGRENRDFTLTKTLVIPKGQHLNLARFFIDDTNTLTGIKLSIYNGNESDCFGLCPTYSTPKKTAEGTKTVYFSNKDNIIGVFGYADKNGINSLGFLLNIRKGTEGLYFVTDTPDI